MVKRKATQKQALPPVETVLKRKKTSQVNTESPKMAKVQPIIEPKMTRSVTKASQEAAESNKFGVHPLLIDHILDQVFQNLIGPSANPPTPNEAAGISNDVKSIRLVCKQWNETATRLYRRTRNPASFGVVVDPYSRSKNQTFDLRMEKFLDTMKNSQMMPVQRYTISAHFFIKQNQRLMKDFMRICGPEAVELRLYFDNTSTMNFTRRSFPDLNLDKLRTLAFQCETYRGKSISSQLHDIPYLIEVLLTAGTNLQDFRFEFSSKDGKWHMGVAKRLGEIICKRIPNTVKILRLDMPLNDVHLNNLAETDLRLEEFHFDCHCVAGKEVIRKLFMKQAASLKVLKIMDGDPSSSISLEFPRFEELLHMEIQGANISPFVYPDIFPKLTILNITEWKNETTCLELLSCSKKAVSLKEIYLPYKFPQAPLVRKVSQSFPNIQKLHISPSPDIADTLPEVFVYFPNVEELHISFPFLLDNELNADSIFSGVSEQDCRRIMKQRNFDNVDLREVQRRPSITNLTKLKKLILEDSACDVILTDFSAHFVFMKMTALTELHTSRFRMSSRYVELLRDKLTLKLVEDEFSDFASDSDDGWSDSSIDNEDDLQIFPFLGLGFNIFFMR